MTIKYIFWNDQTGYGISAKQIIKALNKYGIQVIQVGLVHNTKLSTEYQLPEKIDDSPYDLVFIHSAPYYIARFIEPGKINIAYCTWETSTFPNKWTSVLNQCNAVFVPSSFNKTCFENSGVIKPVILLPHIAEFEGVVNTKQDKVHSDHPFTFYSIGMWTARKNLLELIQVFKKAFPNNENVRLILKTSLKDYTKPAYYFLRKLGFSRFDLLKDNKKVIGELKEDPRIRIHTENWSSESIFNLHFQSDCYISLCKSEGWGLGAYDAAWFGNPIIITGYGGQLDFIKSEFASLLPFHLVNINEKVWTEYNTDGQQWANVDSDVAVWAMQNTFRNQEIFRKHAIELKKYVELHFNEKNIVESFVQNISSLSVK